MTANQTANFNLFLALVEKRGVDISAVKTVENGSKLEVTGLDGFPTVRIGSAGGFDMPAIRSYPNPALEACVHGDLYLAKQESGKRGKVLPAVVSALTNVPVIDFQTV